MLLFWKIKKNDNLKVTSITLIDKYQMEQHDAKKLWVFDQNNQVPISYYIKQK